ncbi:hypothetical protein [Sphingomonas sp.]|uniref:hypothetical protein n=1 Tax=Sphingomonas sp. TaxID=28214 RepID=UPI0025DFBA16|nr:hypothetical protein [Sphingomonas sp.]MBV9529106.1 hypothetical protein [Sphingomonas sp.]
MTAGGERGTDAERRSGYTPLPFVVSVGVTGHRSEALGEVGTLREQVRAALELIATVAGELKASAGPIFSDKASAYQFVSPLADGADQIAASAALDAGYRLTAVLPFARESYRAELIGNEGLNLFDTLLDRSACVLELPGDPTDQLDAYVMAGRATVAHCDLLIAIWDGLLPRGRGGTGEVVDLAVAQGTPVLHVPVDPAQPPRLLWSAFDPMVVTSRAEPTAERPFDRDHVDRMLKALLLPPDDPAERGFLAGFIAEKPRRIRGRLEYPLLLACAGIKRFELRKMRESHCAAWTRDEWRSFRSNVADGLHIVAPLDLLEDAYARADSLATHFALTYRSGHIFNFLLGALAVWLGLGAFMAPRLQFGFDCAELVVTLAIITNTRLGNRREWHRRWLDYRQLAERLRPMRSLKLLALGAPDPPGTATNPVPHRWIDWYGARLWRAMGCPAARIDADHAAEIAASVAEHEIRPQVDYHVRHAAEIERLDHRLERAGSLLFAATLLICVVTVATFAAGLHGLLRYSNWSLLVSAGFPALGTAIFGIRLQAEFGVSALRSQATAQALAAIAQELHAGPNLNRAADLTEQAARRMSSDLDEWRLLNQQHTLAVA